MTDHSGKLRLGAFIPGPGHHVAAWRHPSAQADGFFNFQAPQARGADYLEKIRAAFPPRPDGRVLFPFRRLFVIAYRPSP